MNLQFEIVSQTSHSCFPKLAGMEVTVKLENCNKKVGEYVSMPTRTICREELSDIWAEGCNMLSEVPKYDNVKTSQCLTRRKVLGTEQNPEDSPKIIFLEDVLRLGNNSSFLRINHTDDSGKIIFVRWRR
jgi:hypothetical protein